MYTTREFSREIPLLRRFARALCGSRERGDAEIEKILCRPLGDAIQFEDDASPRVHLFRAFIRNWQLETRGDPLFELLILNNQSGAEKWPATLSPKPRQAFLLLTLENFTPPEISLILEVSDEEVANLLRDAKAQIEQQLATNILIIEDELFIATRLEDIVTDMGHWTMGIARTRNETHIVANDMKTFGLRPGLILADIQLADGSSGIDAVSDLLVDGTVPVIFITANPEKLLTGHGREPTYLLSKPFSDASLAVLISQALYFSETAMSIGHV